MEGDADVIEAPGFRLRLGARPVLDENILPHRLALLAGVRPAFGGKTRVMAPLFPSRDFNCRTRRKHSARRARRRPCPVSKVGDRQCSGRSDSNPGPTLAMSS